MALFDVQPSLSILLCLHYSQFISSQIYAHLPCCPVCRALYSHSDEWSDPTCKLQRSRSTHL